ncbi:MAG: hypothetical protein NTW54_07035 [Bacteroidetes bacterium]|nr:hypothetical protein [Bacteroidota bacterium]
MDIKYFFPPVLLHRLRYIKHYIYFLRHRATINKNSRFRNIHHGKRCFIIGSGPSMASLDISALANEHVIALNSFFLNPQCNQVLEQSMPEKYYLAPPNHAPQTEDNWTQTLRKMQEEIVHPVSMFLGINNNQGNWKTIIEKNNFFSKCDVNYFFCGIGTRDGYRLKKEDMDLGAMSLSASNALINGLELALYLGFDEIYLIGFEHNHICVQRPEEYRAYPAAEHYEQEKKYDFGLDRPKHINYEIFGNNYYTFKLYLEIAKLFPEKRIVNCTPSGILDVFPRMNFDDVFKSKI